MSNLWLDELYYLQRKKMTCLISPVRVKTHLSTLAIAVLFASVLTYLLLYSCVEMWSTKVCLIKPTKDIFLFSSLSTSLSGNLQPIFNRTLDLSVAPSPPPYLCLHHTILPQHPQPSQPASRHCVWHEPPDHIRGNKLQRWTLNLNLHECEVFLWRRWGCQRDSQEPSQYSPQSPLVPLTAKRSTAGLSAKRSAALF